MKIYQIILALLGCSFALVTVNVVIAPNEYMKAFRSTQQQQQQQGHAVADTRKKESSAATSEPPPPLLSLSTVERRRVLYYVHTGKTGGTSLNRVLRANCEWHQNGRARKKCFSELTGFGDEEESELSKATKRHIHARVRKKLERDFIREHNVTTFLWTLRNPISRAVSAFDMDHSDNDPQKNEAVAWWRNLFYKECGFQTAQDLADMLLPEDNNTAEGGGGGRQRDDRLHVVSVRKHPKHKSNETTEDVNCRELAEKVLTGNGHVLINGHLCANYATYADATVGQFPEMEVFGLRTEKLWIDATNLNRMLLSVGANHSSSSSRSSSSSSPTTTIHTHIQTHGSEHYKVKSKLTTEGKRTFCCFLSDENQIYEDLMRRTGNLSDKVKLESLNALYDDCGIDKGHTPNSNSIINSKESFNWKEWRSAGCPTIPYLPTTN